MFDFLLNFRSELGTYTNSEKKIVSRVRHPKSPGLWWALPPSPPNGDVITADPE